MIDLLGRTNNLLDGSDATNFTYKVDGQILTESTVNQINTKKNIKKRIQAIYANGASLKLIIDQNYTFHNNLLFIDSFLPQILSHALLDYFNGQVTSLIDVCRHLTQTNPMGFDQSLNHKFYEHKLKRFLSEVALGMKPITTWTGQYGGPEGYMVIKEDGDVVCYNIINRNLFEDYLLANTKFDTPSSSRHGFGSIYSQNGELFFKLNLQIRFI